MAGTNLPPLPLPEGITSKYIDCPIIGLKFHYLEAGPAQDSDGNKRSLVLLLHGYPELAYSWRYTMIPLAEQGYYVVAPDQRGYGRTTGWDTRPYDQCDLSEFTMPNLVRDLAVFVSALGYKTVHCVFGHDFGAVSGAMSVLMRPDIFRALVLMSHPPKVVPNPPFDTVNKSVDHDSSGIVGTDITADLARLDPPRKHYKWYHSSASAAQDMISAPQGTKAFLRGYFHAKSAAYTLNNPHPLASWTAQEVAKMPGYYIMPRDSTMPETIASLMHAEDPTTTLSWLPDSDLDVYVQEWERTGFQGGLNWYRAQTDPKHAASALLFAGKKIEVPVHYLAAGKDWGNYQQPGAMEKMEEVCTDFRGTTWIEEAGHWAQQEQPKRVVEAVLRFLKSLNSN